MRIVNIVQRYPPAIGGSETWCQEVSREWVRAGHEVSVLTLDVNEEEDFWQDPPPERRRLALGPVDVDQGVSIRRFRRSIPPYTVYHSLYKIVLDRLLRIYFYGPHSLEMYLKLAAHIRRSDAVFLHTTPYPHNFFGWAVARLLGKPVLIAPHFHPGHSAYERWHQYALLRRCDGLLTLSPFENSVLADRGVSPERITAVGCGVREADHAEVDSSDFIDRLRTEHELSAETRLVVFIGRKLEDKGVGHLYDACEKLSEKHPLALVLVGPGSAWFRDWQEALPEGKTRLIDLGRVGESEKAALLLAADVLALPSRFEAFGIVFLEAWAAGTPVVGSDSGAVPSVLGEGGLTAPFGDPVALAKAIDRILENDGTAERLVAAGRKRIREEYNWEQVAGSCARKIADARGALRVLIASNFYPPHAIGGAELIAQRQALEVARRGHEVDVFAGRLDESLPRYATPRERRGDLPVDWVALHAKDIGGDERNHDHPEVDLLFRETLRRRRPDIVHAHNLSGLSLGILRECRKEGIPTVLTLHDYWGICARNTMTRRDGSICMTNGELCKTCFSHVGTDHRIPIEQRNAEVLHELNQVSRLIAPSEYLAGRYRASGFGERTIDIVRNGIAVDRYRLRRPRRKGPCRIGYHGFIGPHKGADVLLEAMTKVSGATLVLRGPTEEMGRYQRRISEMGLDGVVRIEAPFPNARAPKLLSRLDVSVVPSIWPENHPVSIAEAMAAAIPVVASRIGGIPEMVRDGVTGLLVEPNQPEALADRIQALVNDSSLRAELGANARDIATQEYATDSVIDRIEGIYREALAFPGQCA